MKYRSLMKDVAAELLAVAGSLFGYTTAHAIATARRGYEAVGGELFVPVLVVVVHALWMESGNR